MTHTRPMPTSVLLTLIQRRPMPNGSWKRSALASPFQTASYLTELRLQEAERIRMLEDRWSHFENQLPAGEKCAERQEHEAAELRKAEERRAMMAAQQAKREERKRKLQEVGAVCMRWWWQGGLDCSRVCSGPSQAGSAAARTGKHCRSRRQCRRPVGHVTAECSIEYSP